MRRLILTLMLSLGCAAPEEAVTFPEDERELWTLEETIDAQAGLSIVGLQSDHDRDDGAAKWESSLVRIEPRPGPESTVYPFRLIGTNRAPDPVRLRAELQLLDAGGSVIRTRILRNLMLGPWKRVEWTGIMRAPRPGGRLVANVQRMDDAEGVN